MDEINLAPMEVLQRIAGLFEGISGSICITERGDTEPLKVHPDFRIIAAMNPPTDVGKKDLPPGLRNRFTEIFFDELEDERDLQVFIYIFIFIYLFLYYLIDGCRRLSTYNAKSSNKIDC